MPKQLTIAIDFDDTFTADPRLFSDFIRSTLSLGHRVYIVTARRSTEENADLINSNLDLWGCQCPIVFTSLRSKLTDMEQRGIKVDIWIDDDPRKLVHGH